MSTPRCIFVLCIALLVGCQRGSKIEQIGAGMKNVEKHAKQIEDHAKPSS
ncbi:MAG: hypothetical protein AAGD11_10195 [Planctomycetota bacterium]